MSIVDEVFARYERSGKLAKKRISTGIVLDSNPEYHDREVIQKFQKRFKVIESVFEKLQTEIKEYRVSYSVHKFEKASSGWVIKNRSDIELLLDTLTTLINDFIGSQKKINEEEFPGDAPPINPVVTDLQDELRMLNESVTSHNL